EDGAWWALWSGITPGERARLCEEVFFPGYRVALAGIAMLCACAPILAFANPESSDLATTLIASTAAALVLWARRNAEQSYAFLRRNPLVPSAVGPALAVLSLWPAADPNALYFPAIGTLAIAVTVAQRRREIAATAVAIGLGVLLSAWLSTTSPELRQGGEWAISALGILLIAELLALLVDLLARVLLIAPGTPRAGVTRRAITRKSAPSADAPSERQRLAGALRHVAERAALRTDGYTVRELQVFMLLHEGLTQDQAARWLGVRPGTVYGITSRRRREHGHITTADVIEDLRIRGYLPPRDPPSLGSGPDARGSAGTSPAPTASPGRG